MNSLFFLKLILLGIPSPPSHDFQSHFDQQQVKGSIVIYDLHNYSYTFHHKERCKQGFIPASTFKIFNSLVALETGVVADTSHVFKWDGEKRWLPDWNKDQTLKTAFRRSAVWVYQEIARAVGEAKMQEFIDREKYGNHDISGGIDQFWLSGNLKISQMQQIGLLTRLYREELHFSGQNQKIVKDIMNIESNDQYKLFAKTGWAEPDGTAIGWFVGWIETQGNVYFFATNIETENPGNNFGGARKEITFAILKDLKIIS